MEIPHSLYFIVHNIQLQKATGSYRTYSIPSKTAVLVPEFVVEDLPSAELQPRFLRLQWRTCPWAEHSWWWWWIHSRKIIEFWELYRNFKIQQNSVLAFLKLLSLILLTLKTKLKWHWTLGSHFLARSRKNHLSFLTVLSTRVRHMTGTRDEMKPLYEGQWIARIPADHACRTIAGANEMKECGEMMKWYFWSSKFTQIPFRSPRNPYGMTETRTRNPSGGKRATNRLCHGAALKRYPSALVSVFLTGFRYFSYQVATHFPRETAWTPFQILYS